MSDLIVDHRCNHHNGCGYCASLLSGLCHSDEAYRTMREFLRAKNKVIKELKDRESEDDGLCTV